MHSSSVMGILTLLRARTRRVEYGASLLLRRRYVRSPLQDPLISPLFFWLISYFLASRVRDVRDNKQVAAT